MDDEAALIETVRTEAGRMLRATAGASATAQVGMTVEQFRRLASLMEAIARPRAAAPSWFDQPVDGIRAWVPMNLFHRERARAEGLAAEKTALAARLDGLVTAQPSATSSFATP